MPTFMENAHPSYALSVSYITHTLGQVRAKKLCPHLTPMCRLFLVGRAKERFKDFQKLHT
jgi:hypothetical protein